MKVYKTALLVIVTVLLIPLAGFTENKFSDDFLNGKNAYLNSMYDKAITYFENALDNSTPEQKAGINYWIGQSYMAIGNYENAENVFNNLIENFKDTSESKNAYYHKGRISFLKENYEKTIEYMHTYLENSDNTLLDGNAYYWIGESLFFLGHKEEAMMIYSKIIKEYPGSYKFEAANYRLELLRLGEREEELMKLLKWSHEEGIKEREDFIKKEKEYKQAILSYQKKLAILADQDINNEVLTLKETNSVLKKQIALMQANIEKQKKEIDILKKIQDDKKNIQIKTDNSEEINKTGETENEKQ